jgi:hypothetical protein
MTLRYSIRRRAALQISAKVICDEVRSARLSISEQGARPLINWS